MAPTPPSKAIAIRPSSPHAERTTAITPSAEEVLIARPAVLNFNFSPSLSGDSFVMPLRAAANGYTQEPLTIFRPDEFSNAPTPYEAQVFESPSGLHVKPSNGTDILSLFEDHYYGMIDTIVGSPVIKNERIVINLQDWANPPENMDQLAEDLQRLAEEHNLTIALKWRDAEGPMAREFEPASVREAQEGLVMSASPYRNNAGETYAGIPTEKLIEERTIGSPSSKKARLFALLEAHQVNGFDLPAGTWITVDQATEAVTEVIFLGVGPGASIGGMSLNPLTFDPVSRQVTGGKLSYPISLDGIALGESSSVTWNEMGMMVESSRFAGAGERISKEVGELLALSREGTAFFWFGHTQQLNGVRFVLSEGARIGGLIFPKGTTVFFDASGKLRCATLSIAFHLNGVRYPPNVSLRVSQL